MRCGKRIKLKKDRGLFLKINLNQWSAEKRQPPFSCPHIWLCVTFFVSSLITPCFSLLFTVTMWLYFPPVPHHIHRTMSWFSPPPQYVESSSRCQGQEALSNSPYSRNAESHVLSRVFCVKVDRKCQNRCTSVSEFLANSAPLLLHAKSSNIMVVHCGLSPLSFGRAWLKKTLFSVTMWVMTKTLTSASHILDDVQEWLLERH